MKTQINDLRTGTKHQITNPKVDYTVLPPASSHIGHCGTNYHIVNDRWSKILKENPDKLTIRINDVVLKLTANWSGSGKSCSFHSYLTNKELQKISLLSITPKNKGGAYISVQYANYIVLHNGGNSYKALCPSFVEIL